ncbi:MAG: metallophosphoesterase family protein [Burkholderiales bacterium]
MITTFSRRPSVAGLRAFAAGLAAALFLAGCFGGGDDGTVSSPAEVRYAYVVLGPNGQPVARAITQAQTCPAIAFDGGGPVQMTLRAPAQVIPPRPTAYEPANTSPVEFPVATCDLAIPAGTARATLGERVLPLPKRHVRKILLIADTGCRMKSTDALYQACNDLAQWPFKPVADVAAGLAPDLVVHIGDYHYRETSCPVGSACATITTFGFGWASWEPDFFAPAARLLAAAPWVMVRGDHETCDRGGQGWWRMLDPRPLVPAQDCNLAANDNVGNYSDPYVVPVDDDTALVVYDSSNVASKPTPGFQFEKYTEQARAGFTLAASWPHALFLNHQPILGFNSNGTGKAQPGNEMLQGVLEPLYGDALFPPGVDAVLSGHVHMMQIVAYATAQPPTFIAGNGGTQLVPLFTDIKDIPPPYRKATMSQFLQAETFGFMTMERSGAGWTVTGYDQHGNVLTTCAAAARKAACTPLAAGGA